MFRDLLLYLAMEVGMTFERHGILFLCHFFPFRWREKWVRHTMCMHIYIYICTWYPRFGHDFSFCCSRNEFLDIHPLAVGELLSLHLVAVLSGPLRAFYHTWIPAWSDFWHLPWTFTWIFVLLPATCSFLHSCSLAFSISTIYLVLSDFWWDSEEAGLKDWAVRA